MHERKRIGIIGYGHLGQFLAQQCLKYPEEFELVALWNRSTCVKDAGPPTPLRALDDLKNIGPNQYDLIVEVAHPKITADYAQYILPHADYLIGSPTTLADITTFDCTRTLCEKHNHNAWVPAGALWGGEDIRKMADLGTLRALSITMKKHPSCFRLESPLREKNEEALKQTEAVTLYDGPVTDLCPLAPNNVNTMAAAAVAAHNLGFNGTKARLIADPNLTDAHIVEILATGPNGFTVDTRRYNPAGIGAVTGQATYNSFLASMKRAAAGTSAKKGLHLC